MDIFLALLQYIGWMIVYEECIRLGFKHKTFSMPLFALGLNLAWESIYSVAALVWETHGPMSNWMALLGGVTYSLWCLLDVVILVSYILYGKKDWRQHGLPMWSFFIWLAIVLLVSYALHIVFIVEFGFVMGSKYSAFLQNVVMSILFIKMFISRKGSTGQSIILAIAKWIGTLAPTIKMGMLTFNSYILVCGIICTFFDLIYIALLIYDKVLMRKKMNSKIPYQLFD